MMKRVLVISVALLFGLQAGFALAAATGMPVPPAAGSQRVGGPRRTGRPTG